MIYIDDKFIEANTDFGVIIKLLKNAFASSSIEVPLRHHHEFVTPRKKEKSILLLMPAWNPGSDAGVKLVTVNPDNARHNLPLVQGVYVYFDTDTGGVKAILSAKALTSKRTAAASALASSFLSKEDASVLLMIGTGALSANLIRAHATVRPVSKVFVWGRNMDKAIEIAGQFSKETYEVEPVRTIKEKVAEADIISCATLSASPLLMGRWLKPGQHLDLVGAFKNDMRESDTEAVLRSSLFVDSYEGALHEAGDLTIPLAEGFISKDDILADLFDLCQGKNPGRKTRDQITLFKSVGHALEDLVAARYYFEGF